MINHLKKVFDNYRLKVRDFEDKKAVIIYDSHNIYPEDCVKFDWQNDARIKTGFQLLVRYSRLIAHKQICI